MNNILRLFLGVCTLGVMVSVALPAKAAVIYDTGPDALLIGNGDWIINNGGTVSNPFTLNGSFVLTDVAGSFRWFQPFPPLSLSWIISNGPSGANAIASGTAALADMGPNQTLSDGRVQGYQIFGLPNVALDAGTYWLTLLNAAVQADAASFVSWGVSRPDVLDAFWNSSGGKPEESFQISGRHASPVPEPSAACLIALGAVALGWRARSRRRGGA